MRSAHSYTNNFLTAHITTGDFPEKHTSGFRISSRCVCVCMASRFSLYSFPGYELL